MALFKYFKCKALRKFSHEKLRYVEPAKLTLANLFPFKVMYTPFVNIY